MQLLLLPGMDGTGLLFEPLIAALPSSMSVRVVPYSTDAPLGYDGLLPIVEAAAKEIGEFVVVGESFSGPLALMLAAQRPAGLRGVVLCASFVRAPWRWMAMWGRFAQPWMFRVTPFGLIRLALLGRHRRGAIGDELRVAVRAVSPVVMAARARAIAEVDVTRELRECPAPVMYLQAEQDRVAPERCATLMRTIRPDVEVVVLPGPHLILQTAPIEAARILTSFCQRVGESEARP